MRPAAVACALWLVAGPALGEFEAPAPYQFVRVLQYEQDGLVRGASSPAEQGKLLAQTARAFAETPAEAWREPKNVSAAAVYLFSGGPSPPIRKLLAAGIFGEADLPLIQGAAAYADGREGEARALLLPLAPEDARPATAAHLALAQAALVGPYDPLKAMERLDFARLAAPGTIVEETALRRQVFLAADARNVPKLLALADQYWRRFPASAYAEAFRPKLVEAVLSTALTAEPDDFEPLEAALSVLSAPERRAAMLRLAGQAVAQGRLRLARPAALAAARLADAGSVDATRAALYWAAASLISDDYDAALAKTEGLSAGSLDPADRDLLDAVQALGRTLRAWPKPDRPVEPQPPAENLSASARATFERASAALAQADQALKGAGR